MSCESQKFFIGLMDFFSILLPGALLTYLLMGEMGPVVLGDRYAKLAGAEAWAVSLFASYRFGHLVFLLGSWLDELYGRVGSCRRDDDPRPRVAARLARRQEERSGKWTAGIVSKPVQKLVGRLTLFQGIS